MNRVIQILFQLLLYSY